MSNVFSWPHNHLIHWSYLITSISIYIKSTFHVIRYKIEMKFYMLMLMNAWMMIVLMKCKCQMQCLTLGCYKKFWRLTWVAKDDAPRFLRALLRVITFADWPVGALRLLDGEGCTMRGPTCVFMAAFKVGARHPIRAFGHQIAYAIGQLLLLIVGQIEQGSWRMIQE